MPLTAVGLCPVVPEGIFTAPVVVQLAFWFASILNAFDPFEIQA